MFTFQRTMRSFPFVGSSLQFIQHRQNATLSVYPSILHATSPGYYITLRAYDGGFTDHCTLTSVTNGKAYKFSLHWSSVDLESSTLRDTSTMRAIGIKGSKGPATSLFIEEVPKPILEEDEVLVKVKAFGLNRMDITQREGRYPVPPQAGPILGVEFSGTVSEIGGTTDPGDWRVGDEVFGLVYGGAYAEYVRVSRHMLIKKPANWSWEHAAAIPETWITATQALHSVAKFQPGEKVLWHAGASSVSLAGIQLAVAAGASAVYTTVGADEKVEFTQSIGATKSFNYRTSDWLESVKEGTNNGGVDVIIDFVGKDYFTKNLDLAAEDARIVILGMMSGSTLPGPMEIAPILRKRITITGSTLRGRDLRYQIGVKEKMVKTALPGIESGKLQVPIERVFSWKNVSEAHQLLEANTSKGKIVCLVD